MMGLIGPPPSMPWGRFENMSDIPLFKGGKNEIRKISSKCWTNNTGLPIYDNDHNDGPINNVRYDGNTIFSDTFGEVIYTNSLPDYCCQSLSELNGLVIERSNGISSDKVIDPNELVETLPVVGDIMAVPTLLITGNTDEIQNRFHMFESPVQSR